MYTVYSWKLYILNTPVGYSTIVSFVKMLRLICFWSCFGWSWLVIVWVPQVLMFYLYKEIKMYMFVSTLVFTALYQLALRRMFICV